MEDLLKSLKLSLGDLGDSSELDAYYLHKLMTARNEFLADDISEDVINSDFGKNAVVYYAVLLTKDQDIATNPTLTLLRNKLSAMTKGERFDD